jgi:protein phosphatase
VKLLAGYATDVGRVRDGNEDSFVVDRALALFAVADGMGGHLGGEVASRTAIEALRAAMAGGTTIEDAMHRANAAVFERAGTDESLYGMGTTLTAVVPGSASDLVIGHVGDSRAYLLRSDELRRVTEDHSLVEDLLREGRITEEQAAVHPQRNIITRVVGVEPEVDVDLYTLEVAVDDRLLICSDGLTTMVDEPGIEAVLRDVAEPQAVAERLVDAALAAGGTDNVTVVVIDVRELGDHTEVEAAAGNDESTDDGTTVLPRVEGADAYAELAADLTGELASDGGAQRLEHALGDGSVYMEVRPSRTRRTLRAAFWTVVTLAPIAAVGTIGYVVYRNDTPTTSVPSTTISSTQVTTTSAPALFGVPTTAPGGP